MRPVTLEQILADLKTLVTEVESGIYGSIAMEVTTTLGEERLSQWVTVSRQTGKTVLIQLRRRQDGEAQN